MNEQDKLKLLLKLSTKSEDIPKDLYKKIDKFGGSQKEILLLMGYHSSNHTIHRFFSWLLECDILEKDNIVNGFFIYKINRKELRKQIEFNEIFKLSKKFCDDNYLVVFD